MKKIILISAVAVLAAIPALGQQQPMSVRFNTPGSPTAQPHAQWERQSLPIGNGRLGASVLGNPGTECVWLNEKTLWLGGPNTDKGPAYYWDVNKQGSKVLPQIREAFQKGDNDLAAQLTRDNMNGVASYERGGEPTWRFGNFAPMGKLTVSTGITAWDEGSYSRTLSLDSALAGEHFKAGGVTYTRQSFCSYPDNMLVMHYAADKGTQDITFTYTPSASLSGSFLSPAAADLVYQGHLTNNGMRLCVRLSVLAKGGKVSTDNGGNIRVKGAKEVVLLLTAATDYKMNFDPDFTDPKTYTGEDPQQPTAKWMAAAKKAGYKKLLRNHLADYCPIFSRVRLDLGGSKADLSVATPQRLADYRKGAKDHYLEALYYQFGRYLLIASSRKGSLPANLQGVWQDVEDAPWHADYHNNINIQMNYWPVMQAGLEECAEPFTDYIKTQVKPGAVTAKAYWNARGWTASISANPFGFTAPLRDKDMSWNLNPTAGPWLSAQLFDFFTFTQDTAWLRKEAWPILRGSALFCEDFLWRKPDGTYTAAPSTSPEHGPVDEGTTFSHAVVREALTDAIEAAAILNVSNDEVARWQDVLRHLPPYKIGRYGQLMEWSRDIDDPKDEHRHVNHLFGLHPGHTVSMLHTPELAKACRVVLEHRGDGATGWSMGWKLNLWARLLDGNHAYKLYGNLLKNGTADNLWDLHPPFQIDGNFGGTAGVTEMLLQSQDGDIHILPSLPDEWGSGSVKGLRARGNFTVDITWKGGKLDRAVIKSGSGMPCLLRYGAHELRLNTVKGKTYTVTDDGTQLSVK